MKNSPASAVGSRWSGRPLRSRTVKRHSSGRWPKGARRALRAPLRRSSFLASLPAFLSLRYKYTSLVEHGNDFLFVASLYFAAAVVGGHGRRTASASARWRATCSRASPSARGASGWSETPGTIAAFAELGVVFLLFVIGLELEPQRLWSMRAQLLGLGLAQVLGSIAAIALAGAGCSASTRASRSSPAWRCRSLRPRWRSRRWPSAARSATRAARAPSRCCCSRTSR